MISDVDEQLGRVLDALRSPRHVGRHRSWSSPSDHGEQLGDQATAGQGRPLRVELPHPRHRARSRAIPRPTARSSPTFTENVDVFPTICDAIGVEIPAQCDGMPLTPFLRGRAAAVVARRRPLGVRLAVGVHLPGPAPWPWDRRLESKHLAVLRTDAAAYVQYGDGAWRCFDLEADPGWGTEITDPAAVLEHAQSMLTWRSRHSDRTLSDMLLYDGGIGRVPGAVS